MAVGTLEHGRYRSARGPLQRLAGDLGEQVAEIRLKARNLIRGPASDYGAIFKYQLALSPPERRVARFESRDATGCVVPRDFRGCAWQWPMLGVAAAECVQLYSLDCEALDCVSDLNAKATDAGGRSIDKSYALHRPEDKETRP
jgi:hypothetical protein